MGVVYKARQTSLNRIVAVKMILAGHLASEGDVQRFRTEAEAAANLQHSNIVAIHEVGKHEGQHYFSMDFVEGTTLADMVRRNPLGAKRAAEYVMAVAEAIHYAHTQGTLHRDLKPSNIIIDASDEPRITDFGLAKRIEGDSKLTASGAVLGTPSYMPPEQAAARRGLIGPASDVYSLGAVLYELLTGRPPFQAETPLDTLMQVLDQDPVSPKLLNASIPPDLATICMKCLEKRPERRYHTAQELADDLGRFLNHEPILARPAVAARRLWSWSKRHPWVITAVASLLVIGLFGAAYYMWVENSYLRWLADHPDYVKEPGRHTRLADWIDTNAFIVGCGLFVAHFVYTNQIKKRRSDGQSVAPRISLAFGLFGAAGIVLAVLLSMKSIDARVWEDQWQFSRFWSIYSCCCFGTALVLQATREYESTTFGFATDTSDVSDEMREGIEKLFLDHETTRSQTLRRINAILQYQAATGANRTDAEVVVDRIQCELHQRFPDRVPAPPDPVAAFRAAVGCLAAIFGLILLLVIIAAIASGEPHTIGGLLGFAAAAVVTLSYRKSDQRVTGGQLGFVLMVLLACGALTAMYPAIPIVLGCFLGAVVGVVIGLIIPHSRFALQAPREEWKSRLVKSVLFAGGVAGVTTFGLGVIFVVIGVTTGESERLVEHEFGLVLLFALVVVPCFAALSFAAAAAAVVGIWRYACWLLDDDSDAEAQGTSPVAHDAGRSQAAAPDAD